MAMNNVGRPTAPGTATSEGHTSLTGARGLLQDEPLIFELGGWDKTGVDFDQIGRASCRERVCSTV